MTIGEFAKLVLNMREAQRQYFRTRSSWDLNDARAWESKVDQALKERAERQAEEAQPKLFI